MKNERFWFVLDEERLYLGLVLSAPVLAENEGDYYPEGLVVPFEVIEEYTGAPHAVGKIMTVGVSDLKRYISPSCEEYMKLLPPKDVWQVALNELLQMYNLGSADEEATLEEAEFAIHKLLNVNYERDKKR